MISHFIRDLSQWLMIQGTRESKILGGSGFFVRFSYFMYVTCCLPYLRHLYTKFIMADGSGKPRYEYMKTRWVRIGL